MELESIYEIPRAAEFIYSRNFTIIALQFPDELLKDSMRVVKALKDKLHSLRAAANESGRDDREVRLFVMADTMFGSCCVDEVGASHVDAECVIHYGHTCLSPTSKLPAFFVFGKASIDACHCSQNIYNYALTRKKPIVILFGLEYAHAMQHLKEALDAQSLKLCGSVLTPVFHFANVMCSVMNPSNDYTKSNDHLNAHGGSRYRIGGLLWCSPEGKRVEDYLIFWIGSDNSAFANVVLTFNGCDVVRYDAAEKCLKTDVSQQKRILKRRYYLVEKAKDANIIGILVGTLGVAGYLHMIQQMKELITGAGKKAYTFVMGKPNPAKLANFPECDVFIYVSCAQTALLDSKEYYAPVITPFEAMLALSRGSQWTGAYSMEFQDLITSSPVQTQTRFEEARFSFLKGGYIEDVALEENIEPEKDVLALANATEKVLQVREKHTNSIIKGTAKSGAEYLATRSYQGLAMHAKNSFPEPYLIGRTGRASGYESERAGRDYF